MSFVIDASVVLAWLIPDEKSDRADELLRRVAHEQAQAPALLGYEVANGLALAERRGRVPRKTCDDLLASFASIPIAFDSLDMVALTSALALAKHHGLSVYDAAYLELAVRRTFPLATFDDRLRSAGTAQGIPLL